MSHSDLEPGALWKRYLIAMAVIAGFLVASHTIAITALSGGEEVSKAINISGRQRMLSQRILGLIEREQAGREGEEISSALDDAVELFTNSHVALSLGGALELTEKGAEKRAPVYFDDTGSGTLDGRVRGFLQDIAVVRGRIDGDREAARQRLTDLNSTDQLLKALDDAVHKFEDQAVAGVSQLRRVSQLSLLAALLVLLIEARFIFWPAQRAVARSFKELITHRDALELSEKDLRAALGRADGAQQEINRMLNARTSFFATMSGDLQTPLKILRGYVEQILKMELPMPVERQLGLVHRAAEQMETIIDDVLDVRRIEEGLMEIDEEPVRLYSFTEEMANHYRARAERKGILLLTDVDRALPDWMELDPRRVGQILDNLLSNAVKFTFHGQVTVRLGLAEGDQWTLEVIDTGEGLSADDQKILFTKFEQKPGEPGRCEGGTGLGLPICHDLAALMGGGLTVHSVVGEGSTFRVTLPLKPAEAPEGQDTRLEEDTAAA